MAGGLTKALTSARNSRRPSSTPRGKADGRAPGSKGKSAPTPRGASPPPSTRGHHLGALGHGGKDRLLTRAYSYIGLDAAKAEAAQIKPTILLMGDLLMPRGEREEGIGPMLARHMHREGDKYTVLNLAQRGYNSQWLRHDVRRVLNSPAVADADVAGICIMVGTHDVVDSSNVQHVPLQQFRDNLFDVLDAIRDEFEEDAGIILMTPPCVDEERLRSIPHEPWQPSHDMGRTNEALRQYANAVIEVAQKEECRFLDLFSAFGSESDINGHARGHGVEFASFADLLHDGLYLNGHGAAFAVDKLVAALRTIGIYDRGDAKRQAEEKLRREAEERRKKAKESAVHREKMRTTTGAGKVGVGERIAI